MEKSFMTSVVRVCSFVGGLSLSTNNGYWMMRRKSWKTNYHEGDVYRIYRKKKEKKTIKQNISRGSTKNLQIEICMSETKHIKHRLRVRCARAHFA